AKSIEQAVRIWNGLEQAGLRRDTCPVGIGGGAVCDLAGVVASTYLPGIRLILLPTPLPAQVDAAIRGKNWVKGLGGKNRIGATYLPELPRIDPILLETLPERQWRSGWAEVIKCALLEGSSPLDWLEQQAPLLLARHPSSVDRAIEMALQAKI